MMRTSKISAMLLAVLFAISAAVSADEAKPQTEQIIVISDLEGEIMDGVTLGGWWDYRNGGTSGRLELTDDNPAAGKKCAVLYYDSTYGNRRSFIQTKMYHSLPPSSKELSIQVRSPQGGTLFLRFLGSDGQTHQYRLRTKNDNKWKKFSIDLTKKSPESWGKNRDKIIRQPVRNLIFLITARKPKTGKIYLDQIEVTTSASPAKLAEWFWNRKNAKICLQTSLPGNLYYEGKPVEARIVAMPAPPQDMKLDVNVEVFDVDKKKVKEYSDLKLNKGNGFSVPISLPKKDGIYYVTMNVSDGKHKAIAKSRYAVIPPNPAMDKYEKDSPFGTQTHFRQWWQPRVGKIVKRAGIAWIREDTGLNDVGLSVAKANKLCYMPVLPWGRNRTPKTLKAAKEAGKVLDETWDFSKEVELHRKYAERYGKDIDVYDLINEPHIPWGPALGGNWNGGEWQKMFSILVGRISDAIKKADPGAKVLWEDGDKLAWYKNWVKLGVADKIDYISPHTYNLHRSSPLPEDQFVVNTKLQQFPKFREFCKKNNLPWKVWAGEVGFSTFTIGVKKNGKKTNHYYTPCTEIEQAQNLVRMMVCQLYNGMEKIFWYDFQNDGWDPHNQEHNFGVILRNFLPKPAVVAYANLISRLRGTKWLGRYRIGGLCEAIAFSQKDGSKPTLIVWKKTGTKIRKIRVHSGVKELTITDIYGRSKRVKVKDDVVTLKAGPSPLYVEGLKMSDITPRLSKREW